LNHAIFTENQSQAEEQILQKAKRDPAEFRPIYEQYYKRIFLFVHHRVGDKQQTADITSQIFLKALQKIHSFQFKGFPFSSWLFRIAVNECNDFFRKTRRQRLVILEEAHAEILYEEMFGDEAMQELKTTLPIILTQLDEKELQFIELRFLEEKPFKEVAEILGVSENYAKVKTYRVLEKMKKLFISK
jgi:RNA polymerase sigma-70 factor (ECF subfamily)